MSGDVRELIEAKLAEIEASASAVPLPVGRAMMADYSPIRAMITSHDEPGSHNGPVVGLAANPAAVLAMVAGIRAVVALGPSTCGGYDDPPLADWPYDQMKHYPDPEYAGYCDGCAAAEAADSVWLSACRAIAAIWDIK